MKVAIAYHGTRMKATEDHIHGAERHEPFPTMQSITGRFAQAGYQTVQVDACIDFIRGMREVKPDIVFNLYSVAGGTEQLFVPAVLEHLGIPFTGSSALAHGLAMNKPLAKRLFIQAGIPTPPFITATPITGGQARRAKINLTRLRFPVIVTSAGGGSSEGLDYTSVTDSIEKTEALVRKILTTGSEALVSEYIEGRELTVGFLGNETLQPFPILEKHFTPPPGQPAIFTGAIKERPRHWHDQVSVPKLSPKLQAQVIEVAEKAFRAIDCSDYARIDIRLGKDNIPYVLELNSLPGIYPEYSSLTRMGEEMDWSTEDIALRILETALSRIRAK